MRRAGGGRQRMECAAWVRGAIPGGGFNPPLFVVPAVAAAHAWTGRGVTDAGRDAAAAVVAAVTAAAGSHQLSSPKY